jgi:hypothetical protein
LEGGLALCDLTAVTYEGKTCPLAALGHGGEKGKLSAKFGLVTDARGCPVKVTVHPGNTADSDTFQDEVKRVRREFKLDTVAVVGDRGMITQARIQEELAPAQRLGLADRQLDWITALRAPQIRQLVQAGALQLSLFDQRDLAEITSPDYPGERLVVCRNPLLATERARKREELLQATEQELDRIVQATRRTARPLRGQEQIA